MDEKKVPIRLGKFISALSDKLSGEQLLACIEEARRFEHSPETLSGREQEIATWILDDDELAEYYRKEHQAAIDDLRERSNRCRYALEYVTKTSPVPGHNYDVGSMLRSIISCAESGLESLKRLRESVEEADQKLG